MAIVNFKSLRLIIESSPAWKNDTFSRMENGLELQSLRRLSLEYLHFTESFPDILSRLICRVDGELMFWLVQILHSELGNGVEADSHDRLFRRLCLDIGVSKSDLIQGPKLDSTKKFVHSLRELYGKGPLWQAIGAQFALEYQADNMLRKLRDAYQILESDTKAESEGIHFFKVHEDEEPEHVAAMEKLIAKGLGSESQKADIEQGTMACVDEFGRFWSGVGNTI